MLWALLSPGSQKLWSWPSHLCGLHNASPSLPWKDVLISHHLHDTGRSHTRLRSKELHLVSPSQLWVSNPAYHTAGNDRRYPSLVSSTPTTLCNLVALSTVEEPTNTKAEMWQVTAEDWEQVISLSVLWSTPIPKHMYTLKHTQIFVLGCSEFPPSHTPK